ncbi:MAG: DUF1616 domain-containing protein [Haloferacaceae archaeon]
MIDNESGRTTVGADHGVASGFPVDAVLVGLYALSAPVADAVLVGSTLRLLFLGPLLLFVPGYVLLLVLFPASPEAAPAGGDRRRSTRTLDGAERAALSVGSSVALLPLVGFVMFLAFGSVTGPLVPILSAFTLVGLVAGVLRRRAVPEGRRFVVPFGRWARKATAGVTEVSRSRALVNLFLGVCVASVILVLAMGLAAPQSDTAMTNVAIGTGTGEEFTTTGYSGGANATETRSYTLLIENQEGRQVDYTVVVQLQRVSDGSVVESTETDRFVVSLENGESNFMTHTVDPVLVGDSVRLAYLIYAGDIPPNPRGETAYRTTHVWIGSGEQDAG